MTCMHDDVYTYLGSNLIFQFGMKKCKELSQERAGSNNET